MSSLTHTFVTDAAQTIDHTRTFGLALENRFKDYLLNGNHPFWPVDGNGDPLPESDANYAQAFRNKADHDMLALLDAIERYEQDRDAQAARDAVPPPAFD
jgi:hypothetical protein